MNKPMSTATRSLDNGERPESFGIASTARIAGHPIHSMLVPFPIAFLIGALLADLAFWNTRDPFWAVAGAWLVGAGVAGGALAALAGLTDFLGSRRIRALGTAWVHFLGNATAIVLAILNLYLRTSATSATEAVLPWGLALSAAVVAIFAVTGWLGWELVYRHGGERDRAFVRPVSRGYRPPEHPSR
jgi:uncharacterized membrane protein